MLHIAIVEDDAAVQRWLRDQLKTCFSDLRAAVEFDLFPSGDAFLTMVREHYHFDAVFLDIEMPGMPGIETARKLAALQPEVKVLFVSGREDLVYDTFEVRPFRFLPKKRLEQMLPEAVGALVRDIDLTRSDMLVLTEASGDMFSFSTRTIVYIEARNKVCRIVTRSGEALVHCRLMDIEKRLPADGFIKVHRSYIVRASSIYLIGKQTVSLDTGEELPLSRNRAADVRNGFLRYAGDRP